MTIKRLWQTFRLFTIRGSKKRAEYIRKHHVYREMGENCTIQKRKIPLYPNLIRLGNNVHIASNVSFLTHDGINLLMENVGEYASEAQERVGCIEIGDNVFIGSGTHILYDTKIGNNVIISTCSVVTKDIPDNSIAAGVPARVIGSFDEYVEKMKRTKMYPDALKPNKQTVCDELANYLWDEFDKKHTSINR